MPENLTPRQVVKGMLQGNPPPRPLFLPIVFSLGARLENLPLRAFLGNATKISNSLRQIRSHLRSDGVACYFDPCLELEALGGTLCWDADDQPAIHWPSSAAKGALPEGLRSPEEAARCGRVPVATEVIRRLKALLQDHPVLMAGVAGPYTLAARLARLDREDGLLAGEVPESALEFATAAMQQISTALVEAGANAIFIQEAMLPALSDQDCDTWASLLAPTLNIVRFYEALPVLLLANSSAFAENGVVILQRHWDCAVCPVLDATSSQVLREVHRVGDTMLGIALDLENGPGGAEPGLLLNHLMSEFRPVLVTTAGDVSKSADMQRLAKVGENVRH